MPDSVMMPREGEFLLTEVARGLWARKWVIVVVSVALAALTFGFSTFLEKRYEADIDLLVNPSFRPGTATLRITLPTVRELVLNRSLAQQLIDEFDLGASPHDLDAVTFVDERLKVMTPNGTEMLRVTVLLADPDVAAAVANRLAELVIELNRQIYEARADAYIDFTRGQLDRARKRSEASAARFREFWANSASEMLEQDAAVFLVERAIHLLAEATGERARLMRAEEELAPTEFATSSSNVQVIDPATPPAYPVSPYPMLNALLGLVVGLLLASAIVVVESTVRAPTS